MMNYRTKKTKKSQKKRVRLLLALIICVAATLAYLQTRLWVADLSYEYHQLNKKLSATKQENSRLRVEVRRLKSPARVDKIAREKMQLLPQEELKPTVRIITSSSLNN